MKKLNITKLIRNIAEHNTAQQIIELYELGGEINDDCTGKMKFITPESGLVITPRKSGNYDVYIGVNWWYADEERFEVAGAVLSYDPEVNLLTSMQSSGMSYTYEDWNEMHKSED